VPAPALAGARQSRRCPAADLCSCSRGQRGASCWFCPKAAVRAMSARLLLLCLLFRSSWLTVTGGRGRRRHSAASPGRTGSRGRVGRRGWWRSEARASVRELGSIETSALRESRSSAPARVARACRPTQQPRPAVAAAVPDRLCHRDFVGQSRTPAQRRGRKSGEGRRLGSLVVEAGYAARPCGVLPRVVLGSRCGRGALFADLLAVSIRQIGGLSGQIGGLQ